MLASQHISTTDNGIIHAINREERLSIMEMKKIAFFDTKPYDRESFERQNKTLSLLVSLPNVIVTSHQAFLTHEALANIATTTLKNLDDYFAGAPLENEICYRCLGTGGAAKSNCPRRANGRCH